MQSMRSNFPGQYQRYVSCNRKKLSQSPSFPLVPSPPILTPTALSEPIDVYSEWVDACEAVRKEPSASDPSSRAVAADEEAAEDADGGELSDLDEAEFD